VGPDAIRQLGDAIRRLHGCESRYVEAVPVTETFKRDVVWSGIVHVFDLVDCDKAERAYAWAELVDDWSGRQRFTAVLQVDPVKTPQDAVRVSILARYREEHPST
jgi:hypothetical protein